MQLVVDLGNTQAKVALFDGDVIKHLEVLDSMSAVWLKDFIHNNSNINAAIVASVINHDHALMEELKPISTSILLNPNTPLPIQNKYATPATLGHDRLAAAVGAHSYHLGNDILAVDAGTCIKYDFVSAKGAYLGGGISPGLMMRFKSLQHFTQKLPLVFPHPTVDLIGNSTENSILSGVVNGLAAEVDGIIAQYKEQYFDLKVIVSGGDAKFLAKNLKSNIFVAPNLVLEGLNKILLHNV